MFGKSKKIHSIKYLLLISGLPNFKNDTIIEIIINETEQVITFKSLDTNSSTATLSFNKITRLFCDTKATIIPTGFINTKTKLLQTMKINYISNNCEKEIFLSETNHNGTASFNLLKVLIEKNIRSESNEKHINL